MADTQTLPEPTPEQIAQLPAHLERWYKVATCTDPADREKAERGIAGCYASSNLPCPPFLWVKSLLALAICSPIAALEMMDKPDTKIPDLQKMVDDIAAACLSEDGVYPLTERQYEAASAHWMCFIGAQLWAGWQALQSFYREIVGVKLDPKDEAVNDAFQAVSESCSWFWAGSNICVVVDRPDRIFIEDGPDGAFRFHCADGSALRFRDGYARWFIHGVELDQQIVEKPETQVLDQIVKDTNNESRRIRIERWAGGAHEPIYGWQRYLTETGSKVIDKRNNDTENTREILYLNDLKEKHFVGPCPSTGRIYALQVPKEVMTCEQAQNFFWSGSLLQRNLEQQGRPFRPIGRS